MRMDTQVIEAALENGDDEALPTGGVERIPRAKGQLERPGRNRTLRRPDQERDFLEISLPEGSKPVVVLPEVQAAQPPEKTKERNEMETPTTTQTRPEYEVCPVCGLFNKAANKTTNEGKPIRYLVCKGCDDRYLAYAKTVAAQLAAGQKPEVLSKIEWVLSQLDLGRFERELEAARRKRTDAPARIDENVRVAANGKSLPREIFTALRAKIQEEVSNEDYFMVRRLNARLKAATKLKPELEQAPPTTPQGGS